METLVSIVDALVLLFLIGWVPYRIRKELPEGFGALLLSICVALVMIAFGMASFIASGAYSSNGVKQVASLVALVIMVILIRVAAASKPAA